MQVAVQPDAPLLVADLACWLNAPLAPWGKRFWAEAELSSPANAHLELRSAPEHVQDAIASAHPVVSDAKLSLNTKINTLPDDLHAAVCQAAITACAREPGVLSLKSVSIEDSTALAKIAAVIPRLRGCSAVSIAMSGSAQGGCALDAAVQAAFNAGLGCKSVDIVSVSSADLDNVALLQAQHIIETTPHQVKRVKMKATCYSSALRLLTALELIDKPKLSCLTSLNLHHVPVHGAGSIEKLLTQLSGICKHLEVLHLVPSKGLQSDWYKVFSSVKQLTSLRELMINEVAISFEGCFVLCQSLCCLANLQELRLGSTSGAGSVWQDQLVPALSQLPWLRLLHLGAVDWAPMTMQSSLVGLQENTQLQQLHLTWQRLSPRFVDALASGLAGLTQVSHLHLGALDRHGARASQAFASMAALRSLVLEDVDAMPGFCDGLAAATQLESLTAHGWRCRLGFRPVADALQQLQGLRHFAAFNSPGMAHRRDIDAWQLAFTFSLG